MPNVYLPERSALSRQRSSTSQPSWLLSTASAPAAARVLMAEGDALQYPTRSPSAELTAVTARLALPMRSRCDASWHLLPFSSDDDDDGYQRTNHAS